MCVHVRSFLYLMQNKLEGLKNLNFATGLLVHNTLLVKPGASHVSWDLHFQHRIWKWPACVEEHLIRGVSEILWVHMHETLSNHVLRCQLGSLVVRKSLAVEMGAENNDSMAIFLSPPKIWILARGTRNNHDNRSGQGIALPKDPEKQITLFSFSSYYVSRSCSRIFGIYWLVYI